MTKCRLHLRQIKAVVASLMSSPHIKPHTLMINTLWLKRFNWFKRTYMGTHVLFNLLNKLKKRDITLSVIAHHFRLRSCN